MNSVNGIGFVGTQLGKLASTAGSVRLVGIIGKDDLDEYEKVGFKVACNDKTLETNITKAYQSILADGETISPADYNGAYFFTFVIRNVPKGTTFTITPFAQLVDGGIDYSSASYTVTIE